MKSGKLIIFSAPSGSGKSTIINAVLQKEFNLEFSISATNRPPRGDEKHGKEYYFLSTEEFRQKIKNGDLLEWEEVYPGTFYGTLKSEVTRITAKGNNIIFDLDVVGGLNIKKIYEDETFAIFIQPPSLEELKRRLINRGTDSPEKISERLAKAEEELSYADKFDTVIINDNLGKTIDLTEKALSGFLEQ